jgi:hypothetical protein
MGKKIQMGVLRDAMVSDKRIGIGKALALKEDGTACVIDEMDDDGIKKILKDCGLGLEKVLKVVARGLDARKTIGVKGEGMIQVDDTEAQLKAAYTALRLHRLVGNDKPQPQAQTTNNVIVADGGKLQGILDKLNEVNKKLIQSKGKKMEEVIDIDTMTEKDRQ